MDPWADHNVILGLAAHHRPVAITLGALDHLLGHSDDALWHLRAAERRAQTMRAAPWQADALHEQGRVLLATDRRAEATEALTRAARLAAGYGGTLLAERARAALANARAPVTVDAPR